MSLAAYRTPMLAARAATTEAARALWHAGDWARLTPLVQGWAASGVPLTLGLSGDDLDDVVSHVLVTAWRLGEPPRDPAAWCRTVAHRRALDTLKRARLVPLDDATLYTETPAPRAEAVELLRLRLALRQLADPVRRCVVLRYLHDRPPADIARQLGLTLATTKNRIHRGVRMLAALYDGTRDAVSPLSLES